MGGLSVDSTVGILDLGIGVLGVLGRGTKDRWVPRSVIQVCRCMGG